MPNVGYREGVKSRMTFLQDVRESQPAGDDERRRPRLRGIPTRSPFSPSWKLARLDERWQGRHRQGLMSIGKGRLEAGKAGWKHRQGKQTILLGSWQARRPAAQDKVEEGEAAQEHVAPSSPTAARPRAGQPASPRHPLLLGERRWELGGRPPRSRQLSAGGCCSTCARRGRPVVVAGGGGEGLATAGRGWVEAGWQREAAIGRWKKTLTRGSTL
ncbi:hypothetical protein U9M48_020510 [Paspalum notatum var. saurae]|uniref:Uncharacterized protein n=1 Tax=Paspalum notatum var. saurae TaxID=547442 RepID=A0AAQ3TDH5_PASNO